MSATIKLETNKLILSKEAIKLLNACPGDRIAINYKQESNTNTYPVIGLSSCFSDPESGQKLTKSNTLSFRGNQNTILKLYGEEFKLEPESFQSCVFKLIPIIK